MILNLAYIEVGDSLSTIQTGTGSLPQCDVFDQPMYPDYYGGGFNLDSDRCVGDLTDTATTTYSSCMTSGGSGEQFVWAKLPNRMYVETVDVQLRQDGAGGFPGYINGLQIDQSIGVYVCNDDPTVTTSFASAICYPCGNSILIQPDYTERTFTCNFKCSPLYPRLRHRLRFHHLHLQ